MSQKVIELNIVREDGICGRACLFLGIDEYKDYARCLLFKETLFHYKNYDDWETCKDCDQVAGKSEA